MLYISFGSGCLWLFSCTVARFISKNVRKNHVHRRNCTVWAWEICMPIQAGAVETRGLQLHGEIRLDLLSDLDRLLEDRVELLVGGLERKLLKHEVYLRILHAIKLLDGILYLR